MVPLAGLALSYLACVAPDAAGKHEAARGQSAGPADSGAADTGKREDSVDESPYDDPLVQAAYVALFDVAVVQVVDITIQPESVLLLDSEPETWVSADVSVNGEMFANVGVKVRSGPEDATALAGKPNIKIKLDAFDGPPIAMCDRMLLEGMTDDPAMLRTVLGFDVWATAKLPGPQANFAVVSVNGEPMGLYANVEVMDKNWARRRLNIDDDQLWEAHDSADLTASGVDQFEQVSGSGDVTVLLAAAHEIRAAGADFYTDVNDVIDMDAFLDFWAWNIAMGNRRVYPFQLGDSFVYAAAADGRVAFVPHDMEVAWDTGTPFAWDEVIGVLGQQCLYYDATCPSRMLAASGHALDGLDALALGERLDALALLTESFAADDPRKPYTTAQMLTARTTLATRIDAYPSRLRTAMGL